VKTICDKVVDLAFATEILRLTGSRGDKVGVIACFGRQSVHVVGYRKVGNTREQ